MIYTKYWIFTYLSVSVTARPYLNKCSCLLFFSNLFFLCIYSKKLTCTKKSISVFTFQLCALKYNNGSGLCNPLVFSLSFRQWSVFIHLQCLEICLFVLSRVLNQVADGLYLCESPVGSIHPCQN